MMAPKVLKEDMERHKLPNAIAREGSGTVAGFCAGPAHPWPPHHLRLV